MVLFVCLHDYFSRVDYMFFCSLYLTKPTVERNFSCWKTFYVTFELKLCWRKVLAIFFSYATFDIWRKLLYLSDKWQMKLKILCRDLFLDHFSLDVQMNYERRFEEKKKKRRVLTWTKWTRVLCPSVVKICFFFINWISRVLLSISHETDLKNKWTSK